MLAKPIIPYLAQALGGRTPSSARVPLDPPRN